MFRKRNKADFKSLNVVEYKQQFKDASVEHQLVDVRSTGEFRSGHLPGAINIPLQQFSKRMDEIHAGKPIVVVCASGNRSKSASQALVRAGYTEVYNLNGGTMAWKMNGFPIQN